MQQEKQEFRWKYKQHDRHIIFNDGDEDLTPIKYELPDPPALESIEGYGLKPADQFFTRPTFSRRLRDLMRRSDLAPSQKWKAMQADPIFYANEILFIQREWERIETGYWYFNNGRPTYITGVHYFYLVYWTMDIGHPYFKMRDREWFLFLEMVLRDPYCYGFNYPKLRREGATSKATCYRYYRAMMYSNSHVGLQSKTEDDAEKVHEHHMIFAWREMPFFFQPIFDGKLDSKQTVRFFTPQIKNNPDYGSEALKSWIDYESSVENAYDSQKLHALHNDEIGKLVGVDCNKRWAIQKPCLYQGTKKIGIALNTSTVEEMDNKGGKEFKKLCDGSHFQTKSPVTMQTKTGLYNLFIPATEGLEGEDPVTNKSFIDKYGFDDKNLAEKYLLARRQMFKDTGDIEGLIEEMRQNPIMWKECWLRSAKDCNFNLAIIEEVLDKYRHGNPDVRVGNFLRPMGQPDGIVYWEDDPLGRFKVSFLFDTASQSNAQIIDHNGVRWPRNTQRFVAGGDTFKFKVTKGGRKSNGGGAVFWKLDFTVDKVDTLPHELKSERFICTYDYRPDSKDVFAEDMLNMCVYYGCEMFPETNVTTIWDHFESRGYGGYLFYRVDSRNRVSVTPGAQMLEKLKEDIFQAYQSHIQRSGLRERHPELMQQCKDIEGPEYMTDYDLFTAGGLALVGSKKSIFNPDFSSPDKESDLDDYFQFQEYEV